MVASLWVHNMDSGNTAADDWQIDKDITHVRGQVVPKHPFNSFVHN